MRSASELSKRIRDAKKKREGQPSDLQDADIERQNETTMAEDHNTPKEHSEGNDESNASESAEEMKEDNHTSQNSEDKELSPEELRKGRLKRNMKR